MYAIYGDQLGWCQGVNVGIYCIHGVSGRCFYKGRRSGIHRVQKARFIQSPKPLAPGARRHIDRQAWHSNGAPNRTFSGKSKRTSTFSSASPGWFRPSPVLRDLHWTPLEVGDPENWKWMGPDLQPLCHLSPQHTSIGQPFCHLSDWDPLLRMRPMASSCQSGHVPIAKWPAAGRAALRSGASLLAGRACLARKDLQSCPPAVGGPSRPSPVSFSPSVPSSS